MSVGGLGVQTMERVAWASQTSVPPPSALSDFVSAALIAPNEPVGLQDLSAAQGCLRTLVNGRMRRALLCDPQPAAPLEELAPGESPELMGCLHLLANAWQHEGLRGVLCGRYLPHELSGLLQVVHGQGEHAAWCEARLEELLCTEVLLPLLEALALLLRLPTAPPWLRASAASCLSRCATPALSTPALFYCPGGGRRAVSAARDSP